MPFSDTWGATGWEHQVITSIYGNEDMNDIREVIRYWLISRRWHLLPRKLTCVTGKFCCRSCEKTTRYSAPNVPTVVRLYFSHQ